jgi:CRP-like cAMP-binding protein
LFSFGGGKFSAILFPRLAFRRAVTYKTPFSPKIMSADFSTPQIPALGIMEPLGDEDRDILSGYGEFRPVQPGSHLIEEGSVQTSLYFIISGKLHATAMRGGHKVLLGSVGSGETVGEINLLDPSAASATVTAVEFSQVWCIDSKSLESYINEYPRPAAWLLIGVGKTIARRLRSVNEKIASFYGG